MKKNLITEDHPICVVGLGYVGLPLALALAEKYPVLGFDINHEKLSQYRLGIDPSMETEPETFEAVKHSIVFSDDPLQIRKCNVVIIAVPTPIDKSHIPDLSLLKSASEIVGANLRSGAIVVYESTVYPGITRDYCMPVLEHCSGLKGGKDFSVGYSPERINPGDKQHTVKKIKKIVSGLDSDTLKIISSIYSAVIEAGVYEARSIEVAEAAKVIENSQRDINIAFINELSIIFNKLGLDTHEVLEAANTKWNFLEFTPGLVGGHCIGVDPYYLTYRAEQVGYKPEVILAGRRINDNMGKLVAENTIKQMIRAKKQICGARVLVMGITFKEDCTDIRNSKVVDIISELKDYGIEVIVTDYIAKVNDTKKEYDIELTDYDSISDVDAVIVAVAHKRYRNMQPKELVSKFSPGMRVLIDVKGIYDRDEASRYYNYWRL